MSSTRQKSESENSTLDWTDIEIPEANLSSDQDEFTTRFWESVMRVTFAGFGGALVGLSHQKKMASAGATIFQRSVMTRTAAHNTKKAPPIPPAMKQQQQASNKETNLPLMWATSFMSFVSILESSRLLSPTTSITNIVSNLQQQREEDMPSEEVDDDILLIQPPSERPYYATLADYTLGGTVAGLAGSMSKRAPPVSSSTSNMQLPSSILQGGRRSIMVSGIGTGLALGFLAGVCQTALDTADSYLQEEQARQEELEQSAELERKKQKQQLVEQDEAQSIKDGRNEGDK